MHLRGSTNFCINKYLMTGYFYFLIKDMVQLKKTQLGSSRAAKKQTVWNITSGNSAYTQYLSSFCNLLMHSCFSFLNFNYKFFLYIHSIFAFFKIRNQGIIIKPIFGGKKGLNFYKKIQDLLTWRTARR